MADSVIWYVSVGSPFCSTRRLLQEAIDGAAPGDEVLLERNYAEGTPYAGDVLPASTVPIAGSVPISGSVPITGSVPMREDDPKENPDG